MLEEEPKKIKYVKHPITRAEKKKIMKQGFKIIDARFDPNPKPAPTLEPPVVTEPKE